MDAVTGIITTFAGGGSLLADGIPATSIQLNLPQNVYGDGKGNIYIAERGRIRKVNTSGIISTIAGTGVIGLSGDGGPATSAQIGGGTAGMLFDASGNLIIADRGNCRIRKINKTTGIITTIAGTTDGYSGDNGPATNAQLSGPISFVIDNYGNLVIGDNGNNYLRKVDAITGIITTIAGVGTSITGNTSNGAPATSAEIHPEFLYLDLQGNIYFSNYGGDIRKITNYNPGLGNSGSNCGPPNETHNIISKNIQAIELYPNPATNELHIKMLQGAYNTFNITNSIGQVMIQQHILSTETSVPVNALPVGMYYILFKGEHGVEVKRFMKE